MLRTAGYFIAAVHTIVIIIITYPKIKHQKTIIIIILIFTVYKMVTTNTIIHYTIVADNFLHNCICMTESICSQL